MIQRFSFFQKATLALLIGKDIRDGLIGLYDVLREYLPVDAITFDFLVEEENALQVHYVVTNKGFFEIEEKIVLTEDEAEHVRKSERSLLSLHFEDFSSSQHTPSYKHAQLLAAHVPFKDRGYLVGFLRVRQRIIGHLVCMGKDVGSFTDEHAHLLETVLPACAMSMDNMLDMQELNQQNQRMSEEQARMRHELEVLEPHELVGAEGGLRTVMQNVMQLTGKDIPVLILGETGTGKELIANAIQKRSARSGNPFIKVNCGALTDTLLDSELFGHERGAFTGATYTRQGRFEQADGGTLFLDEVGELSPQAQVRLLRVLQDGTFERIGGSRPITVDVRIIAATNRNLRQMCAQKTFREDLFHRLNVFPINVPPLRQRLEDIPLLIRYLAERTAQRLGVSAPFISMEHIDRVMRYSWPGNVRELENLVERAFILSAGKVLDMAALVPESGEGHADGHGCAYCAAGGDGDVCISKDLLDEYIESKVRDLLRKADFSLEPLLPGEAVTMEAQIRHALDVCNGKVYGPGGAAELLGVNHNTLRSRMRKLGITPGPGRVPLREFLRGESVES